jgi:hypothetical protein
LNKNWLSNVVLSYQLNKIIKLKISKYLKKFEPTIKKHMVELKILFYGMFNFMQYTAESQPPALFGSLVLPGFWGVGIGK